MIRQEIEPVLTALGIELISIRGAWADALCCLHPESNPSFSVNLENGGWVCRHTGEHGALADLVSLVKEVSKSEANYWLRINFRERDIAAVDIIEKLLTKPSLEKIEILKWAAMYDKLPTNKMSQYFFERGFSLKTMKMFGVRYSEQDNSFMFPVRNEQSELVGFVKRKIPPHQGNKYLYPKGFTKILFPIDAFEGDVAIIVEGPLDALWLHQYHIRGGLSLFGSSLTKVQLSWLERKVRIVVLALDNDKEGRFATQTIRKQLHSFTVKTIKLASDEKDVQEVEGNKLQNLISEATIMLG